MKVKNVNMKKMEKLFSKIRKTGLNKEELKELKELSSYFLYIAVASRLLD